MACAWGTDDSVECMSDSQVGYGWFTNVFPSSSDTPDLSKALYKMYGKFIYKNRKVDLKCPVEFNIYTIVRLYKDVFLVYTGGQWKLVRILIP